MCKRFFILSFSNSIPNFFDLIKSYKNILRINMLISLFVFSLIFILNVRPLFAELNVDMPAPQFVLNSLQDKTVNLKERQGEVVILVFGTRKSHPENKSWKDALTEKYEKREVVTFFMIVNLDDIPFFVPKFIVKNRIKKVVGAKSRHPLLDWKGDASRLYDVKKDTPNLFLIDQKGIVKYKCVGPWTEEEISEVSNKVEKLLNPSFSIGEERI